MTTLLQLNNAGVLCWALHDGNEVRFFPYIDEVQALLATDVPKKDWANVDKRRYAWRALSGGPAGYHFFVDFDRTGKILGIIVWGPYGILPGVYATPEAAADAAWEDWWDHNPALRPTNTVPGVSTGPTT